MMLRTVFRRARLCDTHTSRSAESKRRGDRSKRIRQAPGRRRLVVPPNRSGPVPMMQSLLPRTMSSNKEEKHCQASADRMRITTRALRFRRTPQCRARTSTLMAAMRRIRRNPMPRISSKGMPMGCSSIPCHQSEGEGMLTAHKEAIKENISLRMGTEMLVMCATTTLLLISRKRRRR